MSAPSRCASSPRRRHALTRDSTAFAILLRAIAPYVTLLLIPILHLARTTALQADVGGGVDTTSVSYLCRDDVDVQVACLAKACPLKLDAHKLALVDSGNGKLTAAEACHALCDRHDACGSVMYNQYGECYLRRHLGLSTLLSSTPRNGSSVHGTRLCEKLPTNYSPSDWASYKLAQPLVRLRRRTVTPLSTNALYALQALAAVATQTGRKKDSGSAGLLRGVPVPWNLAADRQCAAIRYGTDISTVPAIRVRRARRRAAAAAAAAAADRRQSKAASRVDRRQSKASPVINLGMIKTGTTSLHVALKWNGFAPCKWTSSVRLDTVAAFARSAAASKSSRELRELESQVMQCDALSDNPWWMLFPALLRRYPNAAFVLTTPTSCESWLNSVENLFAHPAFWEWSPALHAFHRCIFGSVHFDPQRFRRRCESHRRSVLLMAQAYGRRVLEMPLNWSSASRWTALDAYLRTPADVIARRTREHGTEFPRAETHSRKRVDMPSGTDFRQNYAFQSKPKAQLTPSANTSTLAEHLRAFLAAVHAWRAPLPQAVLNKAFRREPVQELKHASIKKAKHHATTNYNNLVNEGVIDPDNHSIANAMWGSAAFQEATQALNSEFGVAVRVWECAVTLAGLRTPQQVFSCVHSELESRSPRPASLLRWNAPLALYGGGRMRQASASEVAREPHRAGELCGCSGDSVASTFVGWVYRRVADEARGLGYAHDTWRMDPAIPHYCSHRTTLTRKQYARLRLMGGRPKNINCGGRADWKAVLEDQREYVSLAFKEQKLAQKRGILPDCGFGVHNLYNQVHLKWREDDILAIFYVNDTETVAQFRHRESGRNVSSRVEAAYLREEAIAAAARSYRAARWARMAQPNLQHLPILQYRVAPDCFSLEKANERVLGARPGKNDVLVDPPQMSDAQLEAAAAPHWKLRKDTAPCGTKLTCSCAGRRHNDTVISQNVCFEDIPLVISGSGESWRAPLP